VSRVGGLVFKAQRLLYHSTLGLRVIKKKEEELCVSLDSRRASNKEEERRRGAPRLERLLH